jgi:hypothetical protein
MPVLAMAERLALSLQCTSCTQPVTVEVVRESRHFGHAVLSTWECPYCFRPNYMKFEGAIREVSPVAGAAVGRRRA